MLWVSEKFILSSLLVFHFYNLDSLHDEYRWPLESAYLSVSVEYTGTIQQNVKWPGKSWFTICRRNLETTNVDTVRDRSGILLCMIFIWCYFVTCRHFNIYVILLRYRRKSVKQQIPFTYKMTYQHINMRISGSSMRMMSVICV